jgi:single-stranded DNA-binding protein
VNLVAIIGEVASPVQERGDEARFAVAVAGRGDGPERLSVQVTGAQAATCVRYLRPGHRVAVEGRVAPTGRPAEILAQRVQFLTTRAEARALEEAAA